MKLCQRIRPRDTNPWHREDTEMFLKEKLNLYRKDEIKVLADNIGLTKLSKLKKAELVDLVA